MLKIRATLFYYQLGQPLLQSRAAITNWGKIYYKFWQVLQIRTFITNSALKNDMKDLASFDPTLKILKSFHFNGLFWRKYVMFELKN